MNALQSLLDEGAYQTTLSVEWKKNKIVYWEKSEQLFYVDTEYPKLANWA